MSKAAAAAAGAALLAGLAGASRAMPRKPRVDKSMQTEGSYCKITEPGHRVIQTQAQWAALWEQLGKKAPAADLTKYFGVAAFAGTRNSGGFKIAFEAPMEQSGSLVVRYKVLRPKGMAIMALTQPYAVKLFPRVGSLPIRVEGRDE